MNRKKIDKSARISSRVSFGTKAKLTELANHYNKTETEVLEELIQGKRIPSPTKVPTRLTRN
jgi:hypothetical protein